MKHAALVRVLVRVRRAHMANPELDRASIVVP